MKNPPKSAAAVVHEPPPAATPASPDSIEVTGRSITGKTRICAGIWWGSEAWETHRLTLEQLAECEADPCLTVEYAGKVRKLPHVPSQIEREDHEKVIAAFEKKLLESHSEKISAVQAEREKWEAILVSVRAEYGGKLHALETKIADLESEISIQPRGAFPRGLNDRPNPNRPPTD